MPVATITILEGRTDEKKEKLIVEVTEAISRSIDAPKENIHVIINELSPQNFGTAGESLKISRGL